MTFAWLLIGAALALVGGPPPSRPRRAARRPVSLRTLQLLSAGAVLVGCLAVLGPTGGAVAGVAAAAPVVAVVTWVHRRPATARAEPSVALALDLIAVGLRAGQPLDTALLLAAPAAHSAADRLSRVGGLLRLGADPQEAWRTVADDATLGPVAAVACRSATSGVRLAGALEQLAVELRADARAAGEARAHRAGVLVAAPLGLCFLPSFVCLGIVPVVVGIAGGVLTHA